ncbi:MAG: arylsulfatase [Armatimonadota bacterium]
MPDDRPNLILIMTDQHRGDCLGCDGHPVCETPNLDELARGGARFPHAYTATPSCIPARTSLFTGMNQWSHGQLSMVGRIEREHAHTLAGELTAAGYQTRAVGKMHVFPQRKSWGFEHVLLDESSRRETAGFVSDYHRWFEANKDGAYGYRDHGIDWNSWMARPSHVPEHLHATNWTAMEGINFIETRDPTRPFFLFLSFCRPHSPYDPPQHYYDRYVGRDDLPEPPVGDWADIYAHLEETENIVSPHRAQRSRVETDRGRAAYWGSVTHIDAQIGHFLYHLGAWDLADNTFVMFTSDHGDMLGDHHLWRKTTPYEGSARIPFIVCPPAGMGIDGRQAVDPVVEIQDVMPTLLDAAGVPIPDAVDGRSVLPLMRGDTAGWRDYILGEHTTALGETYYVTDGHEKLVWLSRQNRLLFFNLDDDPQEERDRASDPAAADRVSLWKQRLIDELHLRDMGHTDGDELVQLTGPPIRFGPNHDKYVAGEPWPRVAPWRA